ncbi:MAG: hypothetical protein QW687_06310, partial [Candidatus Hadarchaeales archaeon]
MSTPEKRGEKAFQERGQIEAREREYVRELYAVSARFLPVEKERVLYESLKNTFGTDPFALQD